jgi:hypothetical protein
MTLNKDENNENLLNDEILETEPNTETGQETTEESENIETVDVDMEQTEEAEGFETELTDSEMDEKNQMMIDGETVESNSDEVAAKSNSNVVKILIACIAVVAVLGFGYFGYTKYDAYSKSYALTFEGTKYSVEDLKLFMLFQGEGEGVKESALSALKDTLIIKKMAQDNGVELTEQEKIQITDNIKNLKDNVAAQGLVMPNVTEDRLFDIIAAQTYFTKLMQSKTKTFKFVEADFNKDFEAYLLNNKAEYMSVQLKFILTKSKEDGEKARAAVVGGMAFDKAAKQYSVDYNPTEGVRTMDLQTLGLPAEMTNEILKLKVNGLTQVFDLNGVFGFFKIEKMSAPSREQISKSFKESYTQNKVFELMQADLEKMRKDSDAKVNQKAVDSLVMSEPTATAPASTNE